MPSPQPQSSPEPDPSTEWDDLDLQMQQVEELLQEVRERLIRVKVGQSNRALLKTQQQEVQQQLGNATSKPIKQELKAKLTQIKEQLETIEIEIESRLISWTSFREPFWQIVRFGGLGVLVGVLLKSCEG